MDGPAIKFITVHLFNEEKNTFDPGDIPISVQTVKGAKIGIMVCFD